MLRIVDHELEFVGACQKHIDHITVRSQLTLPNECHEVFHHMAELGNLIKAKEPG
ncbi:MAG: hypothetical protein BWY82_00846 [Verrucomicrobia bacterium ADurb.Bin474]|nr:MAG: hypothetical protein BWY82_00846 [Verrucomicrobia bacterium ADurb.Bin474]